MGQGAVKVSSSYLGLKFGIIGFAAYDWDSKKDTESVHYSPADVLSMTCNNMTALWHTRSTCLLSIEALIT